MNDVWLSALAAILVALVSALSAWGSRKDNREGDFRDDYLMRLTKAEARADEMVAKYDELIKRFDALAEENIRLRDEVWSLRSHVARIEANGA